MRFAVPKSLNTEAEYSSLVKLQFLAYPIGPKLIVPILSSSLSFEFSLSNFLIWEIQGDFVLELKRSCLVCFSYFVRNERVQIYFLIVTRKSSFSLAKIKNISYLVFKLSDIVFFILIIYSISSLFQVCNSLIRVNFILFFNYTFSVFNLSISSLS